jgi:hypothetical protein
LAIKTASTISSWVVEGETLAKRLEKVLCLDQVLFGAQIADGPTKPTAAVSFIAI